MSLGNAFFELTDAEIDAIHDFLATGIDGGGVEPEPIASHELPL